VVTVIQVLIVEDERAINDLIAMNLELVGYKCIQAYDGNDAAQKLGDSVPDLVLLDVMLPQQDGFSLMESKAFGEVPVIFITALDTTFNKIKGLKLGADDYIAKPFNVMELLARVEAVLRRTRKLDCVFEIGDAVIDTSERSALLRGSPADLTNREFELLEVLIKNRNLALSRDKLIELAWGYDYDGDARTVDVHITKLRKKLDLGAYIKTVFKLGYRLDVTGGAEK